ncbi:MAG: DegT/DnrJ/EryC1/StrS family aminotransferase [Planctomycetaceae bacterium]|nr:DegT/DnrJ/EryC1/StrS family aminotransferase [Planctomycetaceae bacterium]
MWSRLRIDLSWRDLLFATFSAFFPTSRERLQQVLEEEWSNGHNDALVCLSVRSGLDLLFRTLNLPEGSEVLYSAITIPNMFHIAEAHGLVPVPVDLNEQYRVSSQALDTACSPRSRVLIVAHLFGDCGDLTDVLAFAREHQLLVVEDCAQAWCSPVWRGDGQADVSLFSFGSIKTATALGGALCRIRDPQLLARMRKTLGTDPISSRWNYLLKILKYVLLKFLTVPVVYVGFLWWNQWRGRDPDCVVGRLTRGFPPGELLPTLRQRPCAPLLGLLKRRLRTYHPKRTLRRHIIGTRLWKAAHGTQGGDNGVFRHHSFWLVPILTTEPNELVKRLRQNGFDATTRGRLEVVPPPRDRPELACVQAETFLAETVFVPCYPELTDRAVARLEGVLRLHQREIGRLTENTAVEGTGN